MSRTLSGISNEAVESATGHGWDHWLDVLDAQDAQELEHAAIVAELEDAGVESHWWRQTVANAYEVERGLRDVGETVDAGYQVGVQRTLRVRQDRLWDLLLAGEGLAVWLGEVYDFAAEPGLVYETADGTTGEVRSVKAGERLRLTWQPAERDAPTTLQLTLSCPRNDESKTTLRVHHEKLSGTEEREEMREHWRGVLEGVEALIGDE